MRQHPLTTSAALLFNSSSLITSPASRLRTGWLGLSIGLHLAAGAGLVIAPYFQFETLDRPSLDRKEFVMIAGNSAAPPLLGNGKKAADQPTSVKPPEIKLKPSILKLPTAPQVVNLQKPENVVPDNSITGPGTNPDGVTWGVEGAQGDKNSTGYDPNAKGKGEGDNVEPQDGIFSTLYPPTDPPQLVSRVEPLYPEGARVQGIEGWVFLEIVIDEYGQVVDARITRSDNTAFNQSAVNAVRRWKYTSPRNDRRAVKVYKTVTIHFTLH